MDRSRILPVESNRGRSRLHLTFLALATALAFAAPLAHAHLDAANAAAHGLCGEHLPAGDPPPAADACPVCLAGAHSHALLASVATQPVAPAHAIARLAAATPRVATGHRHSHGAPRAPPLSA